MCSSDLDWDEWLARAGFAGLRPAASLTFNQTDQAVQAAIAGQGVALAQAPLLAGALSTGVLAAPFGPGEAGERGFYVVRAPSVDRARTGRIDAFVRWLIEEAAESESADYNPG